MSVVPADIPMDEAKASVLIRRDFPDIEWSSIQCIGEGWDNTVYLLENTWVFRFPRRIASVPLLENEIRFLPTVAAALSLPVPRPALLGQPSGLFPWPYYGHRLLDGTTGCKVTLGPAEYQQAAQKLGSELSRLHTFDYKKVLPSANLQPHFDRTNFERVLRNLTERRAQVTRCYDLSRYNQEIDRIIRDAKTYRPQTQPLSLVHGDLYHRHLLFDSSNQLSGIIDWGDSGVTDPVIDLGVVYQFFPPDAHKAFFDAYGKVENDRKAFAQFLGIYSVLTLFWYGTDRKDTSLINSSMRSLSYLS